MYNNSPRMGKFIAPQTTPNVGPSTYIICSSIGQKNKNLTPFLSTSVRKTPIYNEKYTDTIHSGFKPPKKIPGGCTPRSRAKRWVKNMEETPSPNKYDLRSQRRCPRPLTPPPGKGRRYVCRVPYTLLGAGPSIPTKADENGYDIGDHGKLIKFPPTKLNDSPDPQTYTIIQDSSLRTSVRKGYEWSANKVPRKFFEEVEGPGPADYNTAYDQKKCPCVEQFENFREMARRFSFIPRFVESHFLDQIKTNFPGPADYKVKREVPRIKEVTSVVPVPFIVAEKRFKSDVFSEIPSPDIYTVHNYQIKTPYISKKVTCFGVTADRFPSKTGDKRPSPAQYDIKGPLEEKLEKKQNKYAVFNPPFWNTEKREIDFTPYESALRPAPDEYSLEFLDCSCKNPNSVFKSSTARFPYTCLNVPPPNQYDVLEQYYLLKNKRSFSRSDAPFMTKTCRKTVPTATQTPGPAAYLGHKAMDRNGNKFNKSKRFEDQERTPGPADYELHPAFTRSTYRAFNSYNLKLSEQVLRTKLRCSPDETYKAWAAMIKKPKKLRWFLRQHLTDGLFV